MYKTSKWIPITVLFLLLLLCGLLLFAMLGEQSHANDGGGDHSTTPSASTPSNNEPTATEPTSGSNTEQTPTAPTPSDSSSTKEPTPETPPAIDLSAKFPLYDKAGNRLCEITIEDYLCGALLGAISFTYDPAALAAQAIALRTAVYAQISAGGSLSTETYGYTDHAALLPTWGIDFANTIWNRAKDAVDRTRGQVLIQGDTLYTFDHVGEQGVLLAETDIGKMAKHKTIAELLAIYYPSATLLQDF